MTNWLEGVDFEIFLVRVASNMLIWRLGRSIWEELSPEVLTTSF